MANDRAQPQADDAAGRREGDLAPTLSAAIRTDERVSCDENKEQNGQHGANR